MVKQQEKLHAISRELSKKYPELIDYALNKHAYVLALLRAFKKLDFNKSLADNLEIVLKEVGNAKAIMETDVLTQLGLKAGARVREIESSEI